MYDDDVIERSRNFDHLHHRVRDCRRDVFRPAAHDDVNLEILRALFGTERNQRVEGDDTGEHDQVRRFRDFFFPVEQQERVILRWCTEEVGRQKVKDNEEDKYGRLRRDMGRQTEDWQLIFPLRHSRTVSSTRLP